MNITAARTGLTPVQWDDKYFDEYIRTNQFSRYMGTSEGSMIQLKLDLEKEKGDSIVFAAVRRLVGAGVTGNTILEGNEEVLNARSLKLTVGVIRHAVAVSDWDEQKSTIPIREVAREALINWEREKIRADIITSLGSMTADGDVQITYAAATAAQRNTWLVNNADRVLFGSSTANHVSGVMATSLTTLDTTADKMSGAVLSMAKRRALMASPRIMPMRISGDEEWFVCFMHPYAFRDFRNDPNVMQANRDAWTRGSDNPLFTGGDLLWDGVVVREIPEMTVIPGAGAGGTTDVAASFLCGAQAIGIGWAQKPRSTTNSRDYNFMHGVGIQEMRGIAKLRFGTDASVDQNKPADAGVFTIYTTATPDA
jgi:N4-gp56 family major capsid protein